MIRAGLFVLAMLAILPAAQAHQPSTANLRLDVEGRTIDGRLDLALADADRLLGLDADGDRLITWGEVRAREAALRELPAQSLRLVQGDAACSIRGRAIGLVRRDDAHWIALPLSADCPRAAARLELGYDLLFDVDPDHRGLVAVRFDGEHGAIARPGHALLHFESGRASAWTVFVDHFRQGLWHVARGLDHLLFLTCLLLPAVVRREHGGYVVAASPWRAFVDVAAVITAFTIAHAASLVVVALDWAQPPVRWVEAMVAATIVFAAANNVVPIASARRLPWVAFAFGLVHGAGYASVLDGLALSAGSAAAALAGFNLGVEGAQIAAASIVLPLAYLVRGSTWYRHGVLVPGSIAIAAIGALWFVQRVFNVQF